MPSHYRVLNTTTGTYVTLGSGTPGRVNPLTTSGPAAARQRSEHMAEMHPHCNYMVCHNYGRTYGNDWVAIAHRWAGVYRPNPAHFHDTNAPRRTYRVIITDSELETSVGSYIVCRDPQDPVDNNGFRQPEPVDFTDLAAAEDARDRFQRAFAGATYRVVSRYGVTWDEIAEQTRRDWEADQQPPTCSAFMCAAPATDNGECADHAWVYGGTPRRRNRHLCDDCETRSVHHDDIDERFLCDCEARKRIDDGYPVRTKHDLAPA